MYHWNEHVLHKNFHVSLTHTDPNQITMFFSSSYASITTTTMITTRILNSFTNITEGTLLIKNQIFPIWSIAIHLQGFKPFIGNILSHFHFNIIHFSRVFFILNNIFHFNFLLGCSVWIDTRVTMKDSIGRQRIQDEEDEKDSDQKISKPEYMVLVLSEKIPEIWWSRYRGRRIYKA